MSYFVFGFNQRGEQILTNPILNEEEAQKVADNLNQSKVFSFPTSNRVEAWRLIQEQQNRNNVSTRVAQGEEEEDDDDELISDFDNFIG